MKSKRMKIHTTGGIYTAYKEDEFLSPEDVLTKIKQGKTLECEAIPGFDLPVGGATCEVLFGMRHVIAVFPDAL